MFSLWQRKQEAASRQITTALLSEESSLDINMHANTDMEEDAASFSSHVSERPPQPHSLTVGEGRSACLLTISDWSLVCGSMEQHTCGLRVVFPQPYEVEMQPCHSVTY